MRRTAFFSTDATRERAALDGGLDGVGGGPVLDVELVELLAGDGRQPGADLLALGRREQRLDGPVFLGLEGLDLGLAVADEAQRHRLHAAGRAGARQLAPQHRREREADEIVERPAGEVGLDQRRVDLARRLERIENGLLGDGVEGDALDGRALLQRLPVLQDAQDVPGDGLALAVGVGGQDQLVGVLDGRGDLLHHLGRPAVDVPVHVEVVVGLDRAVLRRQVAHVPVGRQHLVLGAQVLVDRLGLGDRFDDDDVHA